MSNTPPHSHKILSSFINRSNKDIDFPTYLLETVKDPQETIRSLNTCNCCNRHAIDRPKNLEVLTNTVVNGNQDTPCQCSCRHTARWICRAFESTIELGKTPPPI